MHSMMGVEKQGGGSWSYWRTIQFDVHTKLKNKICLPSEGEKRDTLGVWCHPDCGDLELLLVLEPQLNISLRSLGT